MSLGVRVSLRSEKDIKLSFLKVEEKVYKILADVFDAPYGVSRDAFNTFMSGSEITP